jgi:hypothetical protein
VAWADGVLVGSAASLIAITGVSSIGFLFLSGGIEVRRAIRLFHHLRRVDDRAQEFVG